MTYNQWPEPAQPQGSGPSGPSQWQASSGTGKQLLRATWTMLRQDRDLLWLPVLATLTGLVAAIILFVPGFAVGYAVVGSDHISWAAWLGGILAAFAASAVSIYFQVALVIAANQRADGQVPVLSEVLGEAWKRRGRILSWAVLTTTVGTAIRAVEQRLGILGTLVGFLGGLAWAIASFFVVPVIVAEDLGPVAAVKRSSELIRSTWGTGLRTTLRLGLVQLALLLPPLAVAFLGILAFVAGGPVGVAIGIVLIAVAVVAVLGLSMVFSAVSTYARALIFRYATGRPVPGVDPALLAGAFRPKRRGRMA